MTERARTFPLRSPPLTLVGWLRYDVIQRLLPANARRVLEIGAGLGSLGALLASRYEYVGLEPDRASYETAVRRVGDAGTVLNESAETYRSHEPFDLVCAFEVLEHCEDDVAALAGWSGHLRPGGDVLLSMPFGRERFATWDERAGHYRRYDRDDAVRVMSDVGLTAIETVVYGYPLGLASEDVRNALIRRNQARSAATMDERTSGSARNLQPPTWAAPATWAIALPFRYLQRPFASSSRGSGIVARGTKASWS